jgi:hypothetical protein
VSVELEFVPRPPSGEAEAVLAALAEAGVAADLVQNGRDSAWRAAALLEAVERDPRGADGYALSPRSTRGATRA